MWRTAHPSRYLFDSDLSTCQVDASRRPGNVRKFKMRSFTFVQIVSATNKHLNGLFVPRRHRPSLRIPVTAEMNRQIQRYAERSGTERQTQNPSQGADACFLLTYASEMERGRGPAEGDGTGMEGMEANRKLQVG